MKYVDMHCDSLMEAYFTEKSTLLDVPTAMVDINRLQKGGCTAQVMAIFLPDGGLWEWYKREPLSDEMYMAALERIYFETLKQHPDKVRQVLTFADLEKNQADGVISSILAIEDARIVDSKMEKLDELFERGYRLCDMTWNSPNCFGAPMSKDPEIMKQGLTPFGKEAVLHMNELGMIVDTSHMSDGGFYDIAEITDKPFMASHSNCREICNNPRNLTDDMIRVLAERGGFAGINLSPPMLRDNNVGEVSRIEDIVRHAQHFIKVGGEDIVGLGTDFDGIEGDLEIGTADKMPLLFDAFKRAGITERQIDKITYQNAARVLKDTLK